MASWQLIGLTHPCHLTQGAHLHGAAKPRRGASGPNLDQVSRTDNYRDSMTGNLYAQHVI